MRNLKKLCAACVLTIIFALPAFAGEMPTGVTAPPPSPPSDSSSATTQGNMEAGITGNMSTGATAVDSTTEAVLSLVQSLAALF